MYSTSGRCTSFLCSLCVLAACLLILNSSVSAFVYRIEAYPLTPYWSNFSITYDDGDLGDGQLRFNEIIAFSGVFYFHVSGETWGPYEQVVGTPSISLVPGVTSIMPTSSIDQINWVFFDGDHPPVGHTILGPAGGWTYNWSLAPPPIAVDFDIDYDVDGLDLVSYISDPSGISFDDVVTNFGIIY